MSPGSDSLCFDNSRALPILNSHSSAMFAVSLGAAHRLNNIIDATTVTSPPIPSDQLENANELLPAWTLISPGAHQQAFAHACTHGLHRC